MGEGWEGVACRFIDVNIIMLSLIIAMAGLPGTGKTAIAAELQKRLHAVLLNKDEIRAELFSRQEINFSREQDDLCMKVIFLAVRSALHANPNQTIIIDGRTFSISYQVDQLLSRAQALKVRPVIIECTCDDDIARQRLEKDRQTGAHPAANRNFELYLELKRKAELITVDHLVIDTGKEPLKKSADQCMAYLKKTSAVKRRD